MSTTVTLTGNLGRDPELRFTNSGKAVVTLSLVTSKSTRNEQTGEWTSSEETWWNVTCWDRLAENAAESLAKGDAVIVVGRAFMDKYTAKDGTQGQSLKVQAYNVGPDLKRATATVKRIARSQDTAPATDDAWSAAPANDPWEAPAPF